MPILEILLAFGLGMFVWYAFEKWQFRRRIRFCSEWMLEESGDYPQRQKRGDRAGHQKGRRPKPNERLGSVAYADTLWT